MKEITSVATKGSWVMITMKARAGIRGARRAHAVARAEGRRFGRATPRPGETPGTGRDKEEWESGAVEYNFRAGDLRPSGRPGQFRARRVRIEHRRHGLRDVPARRARRERV